MASCVLKRGCLVLFVFLIGHLYSATLEPTFGVLGETKVKLLPDFVNLTHLAMEFVLIYGSACVLCNPELAPNKIPIDLIRNCPPVRSCDTNCAMSPTCSPDLEFAFLKVSCLSTDLYTPRTHSIHTYNMVYSCSGATTTTSLEYGALCHSVDEINEFNFFNETSRPVLSRLTKIVYRNKFCAFCLGDYNDLIPFRLHMECDDFFDINSFSSLQEMWKAIKASNCSLSYVAPASYSVRECNVTPASLQSHCNISGLWANYDPQIEWACENFNSFSYKGYSNIFCYICNPSLASTVERTIIDSCNVTGEWHERDPEIERGCLNLPSAVRTYPFKNRFCQICNGYTIGSRRTFGNFSVLLLEDASDGVSTNFYNGKFESIDIDNGTGVIDRFKESFSVNESVLSIKALQEVGMFCGFTNFCSEPYEPTYRMYKACTFQCKRGSNCCDKLTSSYNPETLSVFDQCNNERPRNFFTEMCENGSENDIISAITVRSYSTQRFYKNSYCARCLNDLGELNLVNFSITCPKPLEASLFVSFNDIQQVVRNYDCNFTIISPPTNCDDTTNSISDCRNRAHWIQHNRKVLDNCEGEEFINFEFEPVCFNGSLYKNIFCLICNRNRVESTEDVISECNNTGKWSYYDKIVEEKCLKQPFYPGWYPFKNIYCAKCNPIVEEVNIWLSYFVSKKSSSILDNAPYRILFSLTDLSFSEDGGTNSPTNEFCADGKTLVDGKCQVLVQETANLGYNLTFGLRIRNASRTDWLDSDIQNISMEVFDQNALLTDLIEILQINIDIIDGTERSFALSNTTFQINGSNEIELRINAILLVAKTYNRTQIEESLQVMREAVFNISLRGQTFAVETYPLFDQVECRHAFHESGKIFKEVDEADVDQTFMSKRQYGFQKFNDTEIVNKGIAFVTVNELLSCVLTEIYNNSDHIIATLCMRNITFKLSDDNAKIYLCANDLETIALNNSKTDILSLTFGIFSMVCTLFSVSCLCLTFLTYVLFKSLRTIPAINNMILAFTLFWAQLFLQFGLWQKSIQPLCVFLGIAIHYFWLASFCAMNVCSYHMFKVFHNPMMVSRDINKKTQIYYSIYIFVAPVILISIFLVVISVKSDFTETGYGKTICFLSDYVNIVITFITPACLIILINAVFFSIAYWRIRSSPPIEGTVDRNDFKIYLKLTTITGTAWILVFIDTLSPLSVFSFVATVAGALQGVYIFAAFICNEKVWSLYKGLFQKKSLRAQIPNKQTLSGNKLQSNRMSSEWIRKQLDSSKETFI